MPSGIDTYISQKADEARLNKGSYMIGIICAWAWKNGFECEHPREMQKHLKGRFIDARPAMRCLRCGQEYGKPEPKVRI